MDNFITIAIIVYGLMLIATVYCCVCLIIFGKKWNQYAKDYEQLLIFKNEFEKMSEEAGYSYMIERLKKRGYEIKNQLNLLKTDLVTIQEHYEKLQQQKRNHNQSEKEPSLDNFFENYS
ncbi:hypothetical protein [Chryseobacterium sp.]|jgi:hypothetical protein